MSFLIDPFRRRSAGRRLVEDAVSAQMPSNPNRTPDGTTYETRGKIEAKPGQAPLLEIGSKLGQTFPDPVPELSSLPNAQYVYRKMIRGDASVRISLRASKAPVLGADYYIEPFDDTEEAAINAELVEWNLKQGMCISWIAFLEQMLTCFENGHSVFEPLWELREWAPVKTKKGANKRLYTTLNQFAFRPAETVSEWVFDTNGHLKGVWQNAFGPLGEHAEVFLPKEKLLIFTFEPFGTDPRGMSILRSAYPHWYYKSYLYKIDAIQKERHGIGIPDIELQPGYSAEDKAVAHELGRNMRANEEAYVVRTMMMKAGFLKPEGQLVDVLRSAMHHDDQIMKNVMIQYLQQGVGEASGGRATSATSQDMFMKASRHLATSQMEILNEHFVPYLIGYNFDSDKFPTIKVRNIGELADIQKLSTALANLATSNVLQLDDETEQHVRDLFEIPRRRTPWMPIAERTTRVSEIETKSLDPASTPANGANGTGNGNAAGGSGGGRGSVPQRTRSGNTEKGTSP